MAVVAGVKIDVDARGASQALRQFQAQTNASARAAEQLQSSLAKQRASSAELAAKLRNLKTEYAKLEAAAKASARAGGEGFSENVVTKLRKLSTQINNTRDAFIKSKSAAAGFKAELDSLGNTSQRTASRLDKVLQQIATTVGAAGVGRFAAGITRTAATFEGELRKAAAIEGGGNFDKLRGDIERVAAAAAGTPTEVAALATALSRAGFTAEETGQSLQGIVRGAEATAVTFEQMGSIVSDAMRSFGIETSQTESVVDVLVKTANSSNQSILDLGEALSYAAPTAKTLGISINDLSAVIGLLADRGIRGSRAGTALSTGFNRLQLAATGSQDALLEITRGSAMLTNAMNALGSEVLTAEGKLKPLDEVLIAMKRNLDKLSVGQRVEITKALFGEEAGRSFQTLLASSEEGIRKMVGAMNNAGGTARDTQKEMQGFAYVTKVLGGNVEIVSNQIGDKFIAVLQPMIQGLNDAFAASQQLPKPLRDVASGAAAVGIAVGGVALALKALIPVAKIVIGLMGPAGLAGVIAAGPWFLLAAGITAAAVALGSYRTEQQRVSQSVGAAARSGGAADLETARRRKLVLEKQISDAERLQASRAGAAGGGGAGGRGGGRRSAAGTNIGALRAELGRLNQDIAAGQAVAGAAKTPTSTPTPTPTPTDGKEKKDKAAEKAAREAARAAEQQAQQLKSAQDLLFTQTNQLALLRAQNEYQSAFVTFGNTRAEIERKYNELLAQSKSQQETQLLQQARAAEYKQSSLTLEQRILDLNKQATQPLDDILNRLKDQAAYEREYGELIKNGTNAELAKQIIEINRVYEASVEALQPALAAAQAAVTKAEAEGASATEIAKYRKELERIQELQGGLTKKRDEAVGVATAGQAKTPSVMDNISEKIKQLKDELNPVKLATDSIVGGATAIGNAFGQAFRDVATGAKSAQQALADAFKSIGEAFISMAAEIIAKQLVMIALETIRNALSGGDALGKAGKNLTGTGALKTPIPGLAVGGRANGGPVAGGTPYLVGERGPELFVPGVSGAIMSNSQTQEAFAANRTAINGSNNQSSAAFSENRDALNTVSSLERERLVERVLSSGSSSTEIKYSRVGSGDLPFVTEEDMLQASRLAAQEGARLGQQRTLAALKNNPGTRRGVGI